MSESRTTGKSQSAGHRDAAGGGHFGCRHGAPLPNRCGGPPRGGDASSPRPLAHTSTGGRGLSLDLWGDYGCRGHGGEGGRVGSLL